MFKKVTKAAESMAAELARMGFTKDGKPPVSSQLLTAIGRSVGEKSMNSLIASLKNRKTNPKGVLTMDRQEDGCSDYTLNGNDSVWITVKGHAIHINPTDEGVIVDIYANGAEDNDAIASTYAFDTEAEAAYCEYNEIDLDDVAKWVWSHYKVNFDVEPAAKRIEWLERYRQKADFA